MKYFLLGVISLAILAGCSPVPPPRSGDYKPREKERDRWSQKDDWKKESLKNKESYLDAYEKMALGRVIQSYLGAPYEGRSKFRPGLDCSEFTGDVFMQYDKIRLPRSTGEQFAEGIPVNRNRLQFGDLVFFKINGREISHVGIYVGYNEFAHSSLSSGVVISKLYDNYWKKRYAGARRILNPRY
ncbi:putative endopeptidase NlpC homolog [Candidatus Zixiibacteriota bacterium]|nr:putative endopeptidase NlpC homolog [candidate division Zixibacteria bacterium]